MDYARTRTEKTAEPTRDCITATQLIYIKMREPSPHSAQIERIYRNMRAEFHPFLRDDIHTDMKSFPQRARQSAQAQPVMKQNEVKPPQ